MTDRTSPSRCASAVRRSWNSSKHTTVRPRSASWSSRGTSSSSGEHVARVVGARRHRAGRRDVERDAADADRDAEPREQPVRRRARGRGQRGERARDARRRRRRSSRPSRGRRGPRGARPRASSRCARRAGWSCRTAAAPPGEARRRPPPRAAARRAPRAGRSAAARRRVLVVERVRHRRIAKSYTHVCHCHTPGVRPPIRMGVVVRLGTVPDPYGADVRVGV